MNLSRRPSLAALALVAFASLSAVAEPAEAPKSGKYWVYVGTYTSKDGSKGIYRCELDLATVVGEGIAFALLPVTGLALVALPALDAHTRLLFGRSLAYQVTEKWPHPETHEDVADRRYAAPLRGTT